MMTGLTLILRFRDIYNDRARSFLFSVHIVLLSALLATDIILVGWYKDIYSAVLSMNSTDVTRLIYVFLAIVTLQAVINGAAAYVADMHEASLKRYFSVLWRDHHTDIDARSVRTVRLDQKIIDDAILASERLAHILPEMAYNLCKALVFLALLQSSPIDIVFGHSWPLPINPIVIFGLAYVITQLLVLKNAQNWIDRSENLKRRLESVLRYSLLQSDVSSLAVARSTDKYSKHVYRIRFFVARAHCLNLFYIHLFSSGSIVIPMILSYQAFSSELISFGDFMKIGATYASFQNAFVYIFTFYRSMYQGVSALRRLTHPEKRPT